MNTLDSILTLIVGGFILFSMAFFKLKNQKINDLQETVDSDKRMQTQYALRRSKKFADNLVGLLIGAILAIILVFALSKPKANQVEINPKLINKVK